MPRVPALEICTAQRHPALFSLSKEENGPTCFSLRCSFVPASGGKEPRVALFFFHLNYSPPGAAGKAARASTNEFILSIFYP
ncbi:hypothetical protein [Pandoravirus japonicus]|uniref:Uncharacterized protein n=1 Tax=Pandoravirus japonicus TaxID=2823154 RepID=A0A811BR63_9VIRU|nr:hypothetical protein [Pandoravirus japonicus]